MRGGAANRAGIGYEDLWIVLRVAEMLEGKVSELRLEPLGRAGTGIELTVVAEGVSWGEQTKGSQRSWTDQPTHQRASACVMPRPRSLI